MVKVFQLPPRISALIFDMDLTLYSNEAYARFQIDAVLARAAERRGESVAALGAEITERRRAWAASHGGRGTSLGNILVSLGISMEENIRWREELLEPAAFLREDPRLRRTLAGLASSFGLALVTNNPVLVAQKTLRVLGVEAFFPLIIGLDTCGVSKPHRAPYLRAAELLGRPPGECVSVGDRFEVDIELPLELGMGGVLVEGVEDVYGLGETLGKR